MIYTKAETVNEKPINFKDGIKDGVVQELVLPEFVIDALCPEANRLGMTMRGYLVYVLCQKATEEIGKMPGNAVTRDLSVESHPAPTCQLR